MKVSHILTTTFMWYFINKVVREVRNLCFLMLMNAAVAFQVKDVLEAMNQEIGLPLAKLQVDGGMTTSNTLMQLQADLLGIECVRPTMTETSALGVATAAAIGRNLYSRCKFYLILIFW